MRDFEDRVKEEFKEEEQVIWWVLEIEVEKEKKRRRNK